MQFSSVRVFALVGVLCSSNAGCIRTISRAAPQPELPDYHAIGLAPSAAPEGRYILFTEFFENSSGRVDDSYIGIFSRAEERFVAVRRGLPWPADQRVQWSGEGKSVMWHDSSARGPGDYYRVYWLELPSLRPIHVWQPSDKLGAWRLSPDAGYVLLARGASRSSSGPWDWVKYNRNGTSSIIRRAVPYYPLAFVQLKNRPLVVCRRSGRSGQVYLVRLDGRLDQELKLPEGQEFDYARSGNGSSFAVSIKGANGRRYQLFRHRNGRWIRAPLLFKEPMNLSPCGLSDYVAIRRSHHGEVAAFHVTVEGERTELRCDAAQGVTDWVVSSADCRHLIVYEKDKWELLDGHTGKTVKSFSARISTSPLSASAPRLGR